ncbi:MAG: ABC transporter substrate-binding protein, partial [Candidatus Cloacimonas sp.]|nr:ABC transporter substrate-binding protein [Candidatus Cloacimonas sp.]
MLRFATTSEYPPFSYKTGDVIEGIEADLTRKIADKMGMEYRLEAMSFDALFAALASNKIDAAIACITITPQRSQQLDFSTPYYTTNQAIVSRSDSPLIINNEQDLGKYTIGTLRNTTGHVYIVEHLLEKDLMPKKNLNPSLPFRKVIYLQRRHLAILWSLHELT